MSKTIYVIRKGSTYWTGRRWSADANLAQSWQSFGEADDVCLMLRTEDPDQFDGLDPWIEEVHK